jgi:hypothetical protein
VGDDALAAVGATVQPRQFRRRSALVEKRQSAGVEMGLPEPPSLTLIGDVRTLLLSRMNNFF